MRQTTIISKVDVIGHIWMPSAPAAYTYTLTAYDVDNIRAYGDGHLTRDAVEHWLSLNSGDFQSVEDFSVTIGDGEFDSPWSSEDNEFTFLDCMYGDDI